MHKKKSTILKDALALCAITLVASVALGFVNEVTKGPIKAAEDKAKFEAYEAVYAGAEFSSSDDVDARVEEAATFMSDNGFNETTVNEVAIASENGTPSGYVMSVTSNAGYGGNIKLSLGVKSDGTVTGLEVLEISETPGLGMNADTPEFKAQYADKKVESFQLIGTKDAKTEDNQINAISGATVTSNAVTNTVNAALAFANDLAKNSVGGVTGE